VLGPWPAWAVTIATVGVVAVGIAAAPLLDAWEFLSVLPG